MRAWLKPGAYKEKGSWRPGALEKFGDCERGHLKVAATTT